MQNIYSHNEVIISLNVHFKMVSKNWTFTDKNL